MAALVQLLLAVYGFILLVATIVLAIRHIRRDSVSPRSKSLVIGGGVISVILFAFVSHWPIATTLIQLADCAYVIFYAIIYDDARVVSDNHTLDR